MDIIITNNNTVTAKFRSCCEIVFADCSLRDILTKVRDYIHNGHKLLSHPLSGSVKPNENPYKSVLVSKDSGKLDFDSLRIVENCILAANSFPVTERILPKDIENDFKLVDLSLITSAFSNRL